MNWRRALAAAGLVLFLFWWLFAFGSYYAIQKPFAPAQAPALLRSLWSLSAALLIVGTATALGRRVLRLAGLAIGTRLERVLFATGVGLGVIGLLVLGLGLAGLMRSVVLAPLFAVGVVYAGVEAWLWLRPHPNPSPNSGRGAGGEGLPRWLLLYLGLLAGMSLLIALAPPLGFDSLVYHLAGPRLYLDAGRIAPGIDLPHLNFPALTQMLYALALAVAGEGAAAPLHLLYGALAAGAVYAVARPWFGRRAASLAVAIWTSMAMVSVVAGWAYNDLALTFYQMLALAAILRWQAQPNRRWLILAGLAMGFGLGQKYTAAIGALALGLLILITWLRRLRRPWRELWPALVAYALPALLVALPWYMKNWVFTGNPFYPFLFGGHFWDGWRAAWYVRPGTGIGWNLRELLMLPWTVSVGLREGNPYDGGIGPLFIALQPLILVGCFTKRTRRPAATSLLFVTAILAIAWTVGVISSRSLLQLRLLLPCLTVLSPLLAFYIVQADHWSPAFLSLRRLLTASLGVVLIANAIGLTLRFAAINPLPVIVGLEERQSYLERNLGGYALAMSELDNQLPANSKTLFLWETRGYYAPASSSPDAIVDHWPRMVYLYGDAETIAGVLREQGYTHILAYRLGMEFLRRDAVQAVSDRDLEVWSEFTARYLGKVAGSAEPAYELYQLRAAP